MADGDYYDGQGGPVDLIDGQDGPPNLVDGDPYAGSDTGAPDPGDPTPQQPQPPQPTPPSDSRTVSLESLDGSIVIPLNTTVEEILTAGATGLGVGPVDVSTSTTPGLPGSWIEEITEREREVFLPLVFASESSHLEFLQRMRRLRSVVIPEWSTVDRSTTGTFRLVISSLFGERTLDVIYKSGLSGEWGGKASGTSWEKVGLVLLAVDPFWRDRDPVTLPFKSGGGSPFLSDSTANKWPRRLSAAVAIGSNMEVVVGGEVPVWPEIGVDGPASFASLSWPGGNMRVPNGIPSSSTLLIRTDPRDRSVRLDGVLAWDRIAFDSSVAPLMPGTNIINAAVGTSGADTGLRITWRPGYRTAW